MPTIPTKSPLWVCRLRHISPSPPPHFKSPRRRRTPGKGFKCADPHGGLLGCPHAVGLSGLEGEARHFGLGPFFLATNYIQPLLERIMVRRQKIISMTDRHFEFASEIPNFSKWVRERIEEYIQEHQEDKNDLRWYKCESTGHSNMYNPIQHRIKGLHFPIEQYCKKCNAWAVRR
jgi:hypothetical protein